MFTSIDKALVGVVMAAIYIAHWAFGLNVGVDEATVAKIVSVVTPILIYIIPNKTA